MTVNRSVWRYLRPILRAAAFLCLSFIASAEHLPVKTFTVADGLLRDSVYKIKQDSQGFLWFCTPEGLSRYDGYGFTNFTTDDGLPDRHVNDLLETSDGTVFIATDDGVVRINPTGVAGSADEPLFTAFRPSEAASAKFQVLLEVSPGLLLAGSTDGLYAFAGQTFSRADGIHDQTEITDLIRATNGRVWAATSNRGLFYSDAARPFHFVAGPTLPEPNVPTIRETADGKIWAGLRPGATGGLCRIDQKPQVALDHCYGISDGLPSNWITSLVQARDGSLWIGTTSKLCKWQGDGAHGVCAVYSSKNDLCDSEVWAVNEDKDGNLWVATRCGLKEMAGTGFSYYNENDGLAPGLVNSIFEDAAGSLYTSTITKTGRAISRMDGGGFRTIEPKLPEPIPYFGWGWKQTVLVDRTGTWWIPTGRGLFRSPPKTAFEALTTAKLQKVDLPSKEAEIFRLFEDSHSNIWAAIFSTNAKLLRFDRTSDNWQDLTQAAGMVPGRTVTAFAEDPQGTIWITTGSDTDETALIRYANNEFRSLTKSDSGLIRGWLRDVYVDAGGRVWATSTSTGLLRIDQPEAATPQITRYSRSNGLSSTGVYCVVGDDQGNIFDGTGRGIDRVDPVTGVVENFTTFDGLPDSTVEECYRDRQNVLWFGTSHGLARYVPHHETPRQSPSLMIMGLRVNGARQPISVLGQREIAELSLAPAQRSVSVDFVGLGATLGEKLRYEYKLNDADWLPTSERTLNFADLQSGSYSLAIRAVTRDSIVTDDPALVRFTIAAPIWQRWWFILAAALLGAAVVYLIYRSRLTKLLELERTRTRIATDLHDDIGANLSKIALLSELVKMKLTNGNEENNRMLATIADVSRSTVDSMRDIVWSINPRRDSVLEMTRRMREHAEETLVPLGITVEFKTDENEREQTLPMDMRRELLLIFKEAINNAARHSDCQRTHVDFRAHGRSVFLEISDDGVGIDPAAVQDNNGLANMRARAEKIGARFSIDSRAEGGTTIKVETGPPDLRV